MMTSKKRNLIPYRFGMTGKWRSDFDPKESHVKRIMKVLQLEENELICKVCRHYIINFIPNPVAQEDLYWIMSCFPSTDNSPVRVSIWFPEVFNIHAGGYYYSSNDELGCLVFAHEDYFDNSYKQQLRDVVRGLRFAPGYRFQTGIRSQLAVFMPLTSYFDFVENEIVYESIRVHNYELTRKGKSPFRGHNYEFVRFLFGDDSYLKEWK